MKNYLSKLVSAGAIALGTALASTAVAQDTIRLGLQSVPTDVLYQAKDWAKPFDLKTEVSSYSSAGDSLKAFLAGRVDVVSGGAARLVTMAAMQPEKFLIVAANQYGGDRYGVMVGPNANYKTIEDLKGKKIGVVSGSGAHGTLMLYLSNNKMEPSEFQFVNMKVSDIAAAVNRGIVDAGLAWEPQVAIAEVAGTTKRIFSMKGVSESPNFILVSRDYAKSNPEGVVKYIASLMAMSKFISDTPAQAGELIAQQLGKSGIEMNPKAMELAVSRVVVDPKIESALIDELPPIAEPMIAAGRIKAMPDFKALVDTSFYDKAAVLYKAKTN
jgi:NitT/TauT family transport system substrate-binding protein